MLYKSRNKRRIAELEETVKSLIASVDAMQKHSYLVDVQREGRVTKFIFMRNNHLRVIETMGMWSDDIEQWKKDLLL